MSTWSRPKTEHDRTHSLRNVLEINAILSMPFSTCGYVYLSLYSFRDPGAGGIRFYCIVFCLCCSIKHLLFFKIYTEFQKLLYKHDDFSNKVLRKSIQKLLFTTSWFAGSLCYEFFFPTKQYHLYHTQVIYSLFTNKIPGPTPGNCICITRLLVFGCASHRKQSLTHNTD